MNFLCYQTHYSAMFATSRTFIMSLIFRYQFASTREEMLGIFYIFEITECWRQLASKTIVPFSLPDQFDTAWKLTELTELCSTNETLFCPLQLIFCLYQIGQVEKYSHFVYDIYISIEDPFYFWENCSLYRNTVFVFVAI